MTIILKYVNALLLPIIKLESWRWTTLKCFDTTRDWRQHRGLPSLLFANSQITRKSRTFILGAILKTSWIKSIIVVESRLGIVNKQFPSETGTVFTRRLSNQQKNLVQAIYPVLLRWESAVLRNVAGSKLTPRPEQHSGSLNNWEGRDVFLITSANG